VVNSLEDIAEKSIEYALTSGCQYCDVRAENSTKQGFLIENSEVEHSSAKNEQGLGIRVLNEGVWGFFSISNPLSLDDVKQGIKEAAKTALNYSSNKKHKSKIGNNSPVNQKINFPVKIIPTMDKLIEIGYDCDKIILQDKRIIKSQVSMGYSIVSKFFANSEGSKISQNFTDVVANLAATAYEKGITQTVNIVEGGRGGLEKLSSEREITETSEFISKKASQLIDAKPAKNEKATVIMNPDFVNWKNDDDYEEAFNRLLLDLKMHKQMTRSQN